jgi:putative hydrolase of the HAD superfamily
MASSATAKIILFDGDNTLWDTNAVFLSAQRSMLKELRKSGYRFDPDRDVPLLRRLDGMIIKRMEKHEYDFRILALSLILRSTGLSDEESIKESVKFNLSETDPRRTEIENSLGVFNQSLREVPALFKGVRETLEELHRSNQIALSLVSEGNPERINKIVRFHRLRDFFDDITIGRKNEKLFKETITRCRERLRSQNVSIFVVGDQLDREIEIGKRMGAVTIFKPSGFNGERKPSGPFQEPTFYIENISEVLDIVKTPSLVQVR